MTMFPVFALSIVGIDSVLEPSVMTQNGSFILKSTGFMIGVLDGGALMLSKHLSNSGVHGKAQLLCAEPDNGVVYTIMFGMNCARYCTSPRNFWTLL